MKSTLTPPFLSFRFVHALYHRTIAEELAGGGEQARSRMSGYPSGRAVMTECMVERFSRSPNEWEDAFKNRDNRAKMLEEILAVESKNANKHPQSTTNGTDRSSKSRNLATSPFQTAMPPSMIVSTGDEEESDDRSKNEKGEETSDGQPTTSKEKRRRHRGRGKRGKGAGGSVTPAGIEPVDGGDMRRKDDTGPVRDGKDKVLHEEPSTVSGSKVVADNEAVKLKKKKEGAKQASGDQVTQGASVAESSSLLERKEAGKEESAEAKEKKKKKKKRKRQDAEDGVGKEALEEAGGGVRDVDLSFVMDAIAASAKEGPGKNGVMKNRGDKKTKKPGNRHRGGTGGEGEEEGVKGADTLEHDLPRKEKSGVKNDSIKCDLKRGGRSTKKKKASGSGFRLF